MMMVKVVERLFINVFGDSLVFSYITHSLILVVLMTLCLLHYQDPHCLLEFACVMYLSLPLHYSAHVG